MGQVRPQGLQNAPALLTRQSTPWAAATHCPEASHSSTGKQSATMMAQATRGSRVQQASATRPSGHPSVNSRVETPCTCCKKTGRRPSQLASCWRLAPTWDGASPTWSPRFMLSQGATETPAWRLVMTALTPEGAGQSGRIHWSGKGFIRKIITPAAPRHLHLLCNC